MSCHEAEQWPDTHRMHVRSRRLIVTNSYSCRSLSGFSGRRWVWYADQVEQERETMTE